MLSDLFMKYDYEIPKTNAQGLALLWERTYPAKLAGQLGISRVATSKWTAIPVNRVNDVAEIVGVPREHLLPEVYAPVT